MIRLVVVTGVRLYREGLQQVLGDGERVRVVATAPTPYDVLPQLPSAGADVALLDVPLAAAPASVTLLHDAQPGLRVVALGISEVDDDVVSWAEAGADGYVSRDSSIDQLVATVQGVARGEQPCPASIAGALLRRVGRLAAQRPVDDRTPLPRREAEVMALVERGLSNKEIARALNISVATVKHHVHNVFEKLDVHRRADALARLGRRYRLAVTYADD